MNGTSFLLDTNIVLYLLAGNKTVAEILNGCQLYTSFITQLELFGFKDISVKEQHLVKRFLDECTIVDINEEIKRQVIALRKKGNVKLPDAIIAATSLYLELPLLTADKGFTKISTLNVVLYQE